MTNEISGPLSQSFSFLLLAADDSHLILPGMLKGLVVNNGIELEINWLPQR